MSDSVLILARRVALQAAREASELVLTYWPNPANKSFDATRNLPIFAKDSGVGNYATIADRESEKLIIRILRSESQLADFNIVAEESDPIETDSEWQWVIDPIDGTPPFRKGLPEFGISIGLLHHQQPVLGVVAMPALGQIVVGDREKVELLNQEGKVLQTILPKTAKEPFEHAMIGFDVGYEQRQRQLTEIIGKLADHVGYCVSYGSSATANFRLALGLLDAYVCEHPTKFDIAAPAAIIASLGGVVTALDGSPVQWGSKSLSFLAARTPEMHERILKLLS